MPAARNLQAAIDAARPGSTLRLCAGTFRTNAVIAKNLTLVGAGIGQTVLDGGQAGSVVKVGLNSAVTLHDLTVTRGVGVGLGGGILNEGQLTLRACSVAANVATFRGGGIYNDPRGTVTLEHTIVTRNAATAGGVPRGGGIWNEGTMTLSDSNVSDNRSRFDAAGIFNWGRLTLIGTRVTGNRCGETGTSGGGGGIYNEYPGTLMLRDSAVMENSAHEGGGIHNGLDCTLTLAGSSVSNNQAAFGGGIDNNGTLTLRNSDVTGNSAGSGGGINNRGGIFPNDPNGTVTLEAGSSVTLNTSTSSGGGIANTARITLEAGTSVSDNAAGYRGGGIENIFEGTVTMRADSSVSGNTAGAEGGGIFTDYGRLTLEAGSRVRNNTANTDGGGVFNNPRLPSGGVVTLDADDIVTDNHLADGTTVSNCSPVSTIPNCIG